MKEHKNYDFSDILSPYTKPKVLCELSRELDLRTSKVLLKKDSASYLQISKQCFEHVNSINLFKSVYFQYKCSHPAIMPILRFSISPNNSFDMFHPYPKNGKLSDYIGFSHENEIIKLKSLTPTQKSIISYGIAHALNYIHKKKLLFNCVNAKNIYLDDNFHPLLTNFYSAKKIEDINLPKEKRLTENHLKIDVYAYSFIYAALIEPIHLSPPANSIDDFFTRLKKRERPVFKNSTKKQEKILGEMWDWIPRDRPNFDRILEYFDSGDLLFPGTEIDEFENYKKLLNSEKKDYKKMNSLENNLYQSDQIKIEKEDKMSQEIEYENNHENFKNLEGNKKEKNNQNENSINIPSININKDEKIDQNENENKQQKKEQIIEYKERSVNIEFEDKDEEEDYDDEYSDSECSYDEYSENKQKLENEKINQIENKNKNLHENEIKNTKTDELNLIEEEEEEIFDQNIKNENLTKSFKFDENIEIEQKSKIESQNVILCEDEKQVKNAYENGSIFDNDTIKQTDRKLTSENKNFEFNDKNEKNYLNGENENEKMCQNENLVACGNSERLHYNEQKKIFDQKIIFDKTEQKYSEFGGEFIE